MANGKLMAAREKVAKANAIGHHLGARLLIEGSDEALNAIDALLASPAPDTSTPSTHPQDTSKSAGEIDTTYGEKLLVAAKEVLSWIEIKHRPPVRDEIEHGRMVYVRLHALADLHEAVIAAQGRKS